MSLALLPADALPLDPRPRSRRHSFQSTHSSLSSWSFDDEDALAQLDLNDGTVRQRRPSSRNQRGALLLKEGFAALDLASWVCLRSFA
jgi:hypothetical protein